MHTDDVLAVERFRLIGRGLVALADGAARYRDDHVVRGVVDATLWRELKSAEMLYAPTWPPLA